MASIPALDGVRGLAILLVLLGHSIHVGENFAMLSPQAAGVRLFFVLSGFLITRLLLDATGAIRTEAVSRASVLSAFYMRRVLRIVPLYAVALAVGAIIGIAALREHWPWYVAYLANVRAAIAPPDVSISHLWSLAVEEQFYLIWPWLVLAGGLPGRCARVMLVCAGARAVLLLTGHEAAAYTLTRFDALAAGAWLAHGLSPAVIRRCGWAGLAGLLVLPWGDAHTMPVAMLSEWAGISGCVWLVAMAPRWRVLTLAPLRGVGRISYAVYVIHPMLPEALARTGLPAIAVWQGVGLSLALAWVSWILVERPILRLKRYWPYVPRQTHRPLPAPVSDWGRA